VLFWKPEDYHKSLTKGPWLWGNIGLFLTHWFQYFNPSTIVIMNIPIWVRPPKLLAHLWHYMDFQGIEDTLGHYLTTDASHGKLCVYTYGRFFLEIDISKGV